jgi:vitamin B12 transporter
VVVILLLILFFCGSALAQTGASLEVRLSDAVADCPATVTVTLWPLNESQHVDSRGRIVFNNLPAGRYRVEISAENCAAQDTVIDIGIGEYLPLVMEINRIAAVMPEVTVEGARQPVGMRVFSRKEIESSAARSLPDFLRDVAGIELRGDGTSGGVLVPRIGGSQPEQVLVLVDGRRLQSVGSGEADLSAIPLEWIESVEIVRGSDIEMGGEAIGGILKITTNAGEDFRFRADTEFHPTYARASFLRSGNFGPVYSFVSLIRTQGPGNFTYTITEEDGNGPFTVNLGKTFQRNNADVTRDQLLGKIRADLKRFGALELSGTLDHANRGMPGYLAPQLTPQARQNVRQEAVNLRLQQNRKSCFFENRASYQQDWRLYTNPDPLSYVNESHEASSQWDIESLGGIIAKRFALSAGAKAVRETLTSESIVDGRAARDRSAIWTKMRWTAFHNPESGISINIHPGLRWERFDDENTLLPGIVLDGERLHGTRTRIELSWNRAFHAPSLYSLFWLDDQVSQGNPDLSAETSSEFCGRFIFETLTQNSSRLELTASHQDVHDLIFWRRTFDNRWKPFNLKSALIQTLDMSLEQSLVRNHLRLAGGLNWTEARDATDDRNTGGKYLTFRAPRTQRLGLQLRVQRFTFASTMHWVSSRPALEDNSKWLRSYRLMNVQLAYTINLKHVQIEPMIGLDNALSENYRLIRFAPMPQREWFAAIKLSQQ